MSKKIQDYYNSDPNKEWNRLSNPFQVVEFLSTLHLIAKYFPKKGTICDIGCGPGRYALELFKKGYEVSLQDYSSALLDFARYKLKEEGYKPKQTVFGSAVSIPEFKSETFEAGLFLGPLYHLLRREERLQALNELYRILKKGGIAIASYINSWGVLKAGINDFPHKFSEAKNLSALLNEHYYDNTEGEGFTESYWTTPPLAMKEVEEAGFEVVSYAGAQGFISGLEPLIERLAVENPEAYQSVIKFAAETSELPQYRDATEHLHIVLQKPYKLQLS